MFLSVVESTERRWYETPIRGVMRLGAQAEGEVQLTGHNIAACHVVLHFEGRRVRIDVRRAYAVRVDGQLPRPDAALGRVNHTARAPEGRAGTLEVAQWRIRLEPHPPSGIEPIDEAFLGLMDPDERAVYADSLEDRGRIAEATLMRSRAIDPALAVRTPPEWRRRFLPLHIEACTIAECPRAYRPKCEVCKRDIPIIGHLATARDVALLGHPLAVDPAVRRWPDDLRAPVVRRPRIEMGQPTGR